MTAHPRSRGENGFGGAHRAVNVGSSPLTRGKLLVPRDGELKLRLIPAHAGKTAPGPGAPPPWPAHPRSRGENEGIFSSTTPITGSSPLTRGKLDDVMIVAAATGLIPAHAGKTAAGAGLALAHGAHPRSRGENAGLAVPTVRSYGSSPLTRGKRRPRRPHRPLLRLIPAHAGKTAACLAW